MAVALAASSMCCPGCAREGGGVGVPGGDGGPSNAPSKVSSPLGFWNSILGQGAWTCLQKHMAAWGRWETTQQMRAGDTGYLKNGIGSTFLGRAGVLVQTQGSTVYVASPGLQRQGEVWSSVGVM